MLYVNFLLCCFTAKLLYLAKVDLNGSVFSVKTLSLCSSRLWWYQVILPRQNRLGWLHNSPWKSSLYGCLDCGDMTWYHHDLDGHKDRIFTENYGGTQFHFAGLWWYHNPDRHEDEIFTEKYWAVQVYFGEVALLCLALNMYKYCTIQRIIFELKILR